MNIQAIHNENDYKKSLKKIEALMDATPNTKEFDTLNALSILVEHYENTHYKIKNNNLLKFAGILKDYQADKILLDIKAIKTIKT